MAGGNGEESAVNTAAVWGQSWVERNATEGLIDLGNIDVLFRFCCDGHGSIRFFVSDEHGHVQSAVLQLLL